MKKKPFASNRNITSRVSTLRLPFYPSKMSISRFCSGTLILALLSQVLIIGPIRTAKASSPVPAPPPLSAPPEPFHFDNSSPAVAESSFWGTTLLTSLTDIRKKPDARNDTSTVRPRGVKMSPASGTASLLAAPEPKTATNSPNIAAPSMPTAAGSVAFNFDTDGKADVSRWHPATHEFKIKNSGSTNSYSVVTNLGNSSSKPVPGDYDGNGKTDIAVYNPGTSTNPGTWSYIQSPITTSSTPQPLGTPIGIIGDVPAVGDYDGDGKSDQAVYRPSTGRWYTHQSTNGHVEYQEGTTGDIPIPGDYDADGKTDFAVFRTTSSACFWDIHRSQAGNISKQWGSPGDVPVQGDFDGDGQSDLAVYHPADGTWYVAGISGSNLYEISQVVWGNYGDQPVPADYDGDGITDHAVWRPTTGVWYIRGSAPPPNCESCEPPQYFYRTLGETGDTTLPSAYTKQIGGAVSGYEEAKARLAPGNATGGTNLYSQNFSWGSSLVSLPGRSGLNAGFGISYNSLVWLKHDAAAASTSLPITFDPDRSNISPGFRFGFPDIEPVYYDDNKKLWAYIMVTPDGGRKEFRQIGASSTYETADSGYTQLVTTGASSPNAPVENITIKVTTTDGTQMSYAWAAGAFRCNKILDRNGNYISITNDELGLLRSVTDTLGRVINVNYDTELYPTLITQTWKNNNGASGTTTHTWATFSYTTKQVDTNFNTENVTVVGPPDGTNLKVLEKVTYADGSYTKFTYNSYIQVTKVENYAADDHKLNHVRTNLDTFSGASSAQSDCPRLTHTYNWAENFNLSSGGSPTPQETDTENTAPAASSFTGPEGEESTLVVNVKMDGLADNHYSRLHFAVATESEPWKTGLPVATEDCTDTGSTCSSRQRWTWTNWEQDQVGLTSTDYTVNPRVIETQVGDSANNIRRTTVSYIQAGSTECTGSSSSIGGTEEAEEGTNVACFGLANEVNVYDATLSTVLKKSVTEYNLGSNYLSRRIIGLPSETRLYDENAALMSKVTFAYDDYSSPNPLVDLSSPTHQCRTTSTDCPTAYGTSFQYRGNLTETKRWDVDAPTNDTLAVKTQVAYNIAGSAVSRKDPRGRISTISYTDNFNSSGNPTTYAYPTTVTDPGNNSSTIKYRYDIGVNVWAQSPTPYGTGNTNGKTTSRTYDTYGRIEKETIENNGAYTRYVYATSGNALTTYSTITHEGTGSPGTADEVETVTLFDGAGRVLAARSPHTFSGSSVSTWSATVTQYDLLGRVSATSIPTEVSVGSNSWTPAGDDETRGFKYNKQGYDWKGRPTITIPSDSGTHVDGSNSDGKETLISYEGCGCAGGQVTTIQGPVADAINNGGTTLISGRKTQKIREDILGRTTSTEVWTLSGPSLTSSLYSSSTNTYNGRDQVTNVDQYDPTTNAHQYTLMTYDGHGRPSTIHKPEFFNVTASNPTYITNTYNADDTLATTTDPRGAVTTYTYENVSGTPKRPLVTTIAYSAPSPIATPAAVNFAYDAAGNRTSMSDGTGNLTYTYDELSRMKTETKDFADSLANTPGGSGVYTLTYSYYLIGGIKSIIEPFGHVVNYSVDKVGRTTGIGDASTSTKYAQEIEQRAFGGVKSLKLSATQSINITLGYDSALRPTEYKATSAANSNDIHHAIYAYDNDSRLGSIDNQADAKFDQSNKYDFAGRLKVNNTGTGVSGDPFQQTMSYDAFSNLTSRWTQSYSYTERQFQATYVDNRKNQASGSSSDTFDAAGNVVEAYTPGIDLTKWKFDAAGRSWRWEEQGAWGDFTMKGGETAFDGDSRAVKKTVLTKALIGGTWEEWNATTSYHIYSSVTGQKIDDLAPTGGLAQYHVYMGSSEIAEGDSEGFDFHVNDPVTGSLRKTSSAGVMYADDDVENRTEIAGMGTAVPPTDPNGPMPPPLYNEGGWIGSPEDGCLNEFDDPQPCNGDFAMSVLHLHELTEAHRSGRAIVPVSQRDIDEGRSVFGLSRYHQNVWNNSSGRESRWATVTGMLDASAGPLDRLDPGETKFKEGRNGALKALKDKDCRKAILELLQKTTSRFQDWQPILTRDGKTITYDQLTFFYDEKTGKSAYLDMYDTVTMERSAGAFVEKDGTVNKKTRAKTDSTGERDLYFPLNPIVWYPSFFSDNLETRTMNVLHEIIHQWAGDIDLANAASAITAKKKGGKPTTYSDRDKASADLNQYLIENCNLTAPQGGR